MKWDISNIFVHPTKSFVQMVPWFQTFYLNVVSSVLFYVKAPDPDARQVYEVNYHGNELLLSIWQTC